jgi:hypothetical protein
MKTYNVSRVTIIPFIGDSWFQVELRQVNLCVKVSSNDETDVDTIQMKGISMNPKYASWLMMNGETVKQLFYMGDWFVSKQHSDGDTKYLRELKFILEEFNIPISKEEMIKNKLRSVIKDLGLDCTTHQEAEEEYLQILMSVYNDGHDSALHEAGL